MKLKSEVVTEIAQGLNLSKVEAEKAFELVGSIIAKALASKDEIRIPNMGTLYTSFSDEREGRNPKTGEKITIEARYRVGFSASSSLKELINKV